MIQFYKENFHQGGTYYSGAMTKGLQEYDTHLHLGL